MKPKLPTCYHCKKIIESTQTEYGDQIWVAVAFVAKKNHGVQRILAEVPFHISCFEDISGDEYMKELLDVMEKTERLPSVIA